MANKQAKDSGFKRGFLLAKPQKKKRQSTTSSSTVKAHETMNVGLTSSANSETACLEQEENGTLPTKVRSSALLDLETSNNSNNSKSVFHVMETRTTAEQPQTPESSSMARSSILLVNDESENDARDESNLIMTEVASSVRRKGAQISSLDFSADDRQKPTNESNSDNMQQLDQPVPVPDTMPASTDNSNNDNYQPSSHHDHDDDPTPIATRDTTLFLQCQQNLDRTLWHLRRRKRRPPKQQQQQQRSNSSEDDNQWRDTALEFSHNLMACQNNLELLSFVWETLLENTPKQSPHCLAEMRLGWALLESTHSHAAWHLFSGFLQPQESKRDRILTLGAITMVDFWCYQHNQQQQSSKWMEDLLQHAVTLLGQQVMGEQTRTVLAQRSMLAIYNIVSTVAASCCALDNQQLQKALWGISSDVLLPVWDKHMAWNIITDFSAKVNVDASGAESQTAAARRKCTTCVLQSWKDLLMELRGRDDLAKAYQEWCQLLVGAQPPDRGEVRIGSLRQTLSKDQVVWTQDDILPLLRQALDSGRQVSAIDSDKDATAQAYDKQLGIVRGVVAWLGQSKKNHLPSDYEHVFEISSSLILFALSDSVVHLAAQILNMLWLESSGIPPDVAIVCSTEHEGEIADDIPASFTYWVALLTDSDVNGENTSHAPSLSKPMEASVECICHLMARSIIYSCDTSLDFAKEMVNFLVSQNGMTASTVQVLTMILGKSADTQSNGSDRAKPLLDHIACRLLLDNFRSNSAVREFMRRAQLGRVDPFAGCSVRPVVSQEIRLLASSGDGGGSLEDSASASVLSLLTESLWRNLKHGSAELLIEAVVETLISLSDAAADGAKTAGGKSPPLQGGRDKSIERVCNQLGDEWRRSLLDEAGDISNVHKYDDTGALGTVLSAVGAVMFQHASSTVPLTLFGALLGDGNSLGFDSPSKRTREMLVATTVSLIQTSVSELDRLNLENKKSVEAGGADAGRGIFSRLAPLLLLRRAPPRLFHAAYLEIILRQIDYPQQADMKSLLKGLADHLADRLNIKTGPSAADSRADGFAAEERQMAAEVAGRCLPFNEDQSDAATGVQSFNFEGASCFQRICIPGFLGVLELVNGSTTGECDGARDRIRRARAALYAACHFVPFASGFDNECVGEALVDTASFCLHMLDVEQDMFESSALDQDFLQLQTGCIEFLAVCMEARHTLILRTTPTELERASTIQVCLQKIYESLVEVVQTGALTKADRFGKGSLAQSAKSSSRSYSTPCLTCLWNALIVVSQRCPEEGNRLQVLVETILPWLVAWGASTTNGDDITWSKPHRHPLCFTAALQLAFILVTRSKSFGGMPSTAPFSTNGSPEEGASVQLLYRWSLHAIQRAKGKDDYANTSLRCTGLKVLLAVCTICQADNCSASIETGSGPTLILSERDHRDTCSTVEQIALQDADERNKILASHVLSALVGRRPH